ncbi:2Fe-2S iron-sulfur cluster-binding protein [Brevibacillus fluminis]|uniref:2Fe-2S iron-sulfur cluster-binding protein n=1 Tax=Brevibacillus fluminis TaxID=511487 RepID=UPI003F8B68A0
MFRITLHGNTFTCDKECNLLQAARRHLIAIPYGCCSGGCGMCKIKVLEGEYRLGNSSHEMLPPEARKEGYALACRTYPLGHMVLEIAD